VPLEVRLDVKHTRRGILSMARSDDPHSGGSSFSILLGAAPHLDMNYAIFGCARVPGTRVRAQGCAGAQGSRASRRARGPGCGGARGSWARECSVCSSRQAVALVRKGLRKLLRKGHGQASAQAHKRGVDAQGSLASLASWPGAVIRRRLGLWL